MGKRVSERSNCWKAKDNSQPKDFFQQKEAYLQKADQKLKNSENHEERVNDQCTSLTEAMIPKEKVFVLLFV